MALNDIANQYRPEADNRHKKAPPPGACLPSLEPSGAPASRLTPQPRTDATAAYVFLESRSPIDKQPRYACQCVWNGFEVLGEAMHKKQDAKQAAALSMIYALQRAGLVEILPLLPS